MSFDFFITIVVAYLIGSINFAILISRTKDLPDPRTQGSNNPGATNIYRIAGRSTALKVLGLDILKGIVPTWGSYYLGLSPMEIGFTAIACCLGHMFPVFFKFKGGKAVATALGCLLPVGISLGAVLLLAWIAVFKLTGYSSLAAIVSVGVSPIATYFIAPKYTLPVTMLAIFIILRHIPNILRLIKGEEPKSKQRL
ncbi:glycerol-3-phosphate 1-O-acyltransferase PlsY [Psychrosphaera aestuarii]|uniref:glycerol-3-phosphate 1-O-acyltransferase PlsY n=1 Tax=Psychrosphaera aestuarii TaxID=1266052 RepID=UPI001B31A74C|nr:glycerol-3-phosphate 1-O-acyltransferase PlsY [Psychrosphaera aestuarii]